MSDHRRKTFPRREPRPPLKEESATMLLSMSTVDINRATAILREAQIIPKMVDAGIAPQEGVFALLSVAALAALSSGIEPEIYHAMWAISMRHAATTYDEAQAEDETKDKKDMPS